MTTDDERISLWNIGERSAHIPQKDNGKSQLNGELFWIVSLILIGISSIMGGVNFITTIVWIRAPGMTFFRMPVYVWSILSAQLLQLFCLPSLTGGLILLLFDLAFGTNIFKPADGGDPIIYQHLPLFCHSDESKP